MAYRKSSLKIQITLNSRILSLLFILVPLLIFHGDIRAQSTYQLGTLPAINFNMGFKKDWALNLKWESRQSILSGQFSSASNLYMEYISSDFSLLGSKKIGLHNSIAGGYLIRFRDNTVIHRAIQQFTVIQKYSSFRLAHRFVSDQTFEAKDPVGFRLRYRITAEIPLNGQSVDANEFYMKLSNEYLNAIVGKIYNLEIRIMPLLGYSFTDDNKIEFGLDYRLSSFLNNPAINNFWLNLSWYIKV